VDGRRWCTQAPNQGEGHCDGHVHPDSSITYAFANLGVTSRHPRNTVGVPCNDIHVSTEPPALHVTEPGQAQGRLEEGRAGPGQGGGLQRRLSDLQSDNLAEVISSLHVHLTEDKMMEVHLVQGSAPKGVITARLQ